MHDGLKRVVEWLDRCDWKRRVGSKKYICVRCDHIVASLPKSGFFMCSAGRTNHIGYSFWCPGCDHFHAFWIKPSSHREGKNPVWTFDGNEDSPTFHPSLLNEGSSGDRCHLFLEKGVIRFCADCTHPYRGQAVPLRKCPWPGY